MKETATNVYVVGVGGQGAVMATELTSEVALAAGYDVKKGEVHGMSQRGGIIASHARFGKNITSPVIGKGEADYILAFEAVEALRSIEYLKPNGTIIVNEQQIVPPIAHFLKIQYPDKVKEKLEDGKRKVITLNAFEKAVEVGSELLVNTLLLGVLSKLLELPEKAWKEVLVNRFGTKMLDLNMKAFEAGRAMKF
ncbi:MAG: indolepyruvate oxidoreductase subunit beta [Syntrophorhabdaceae bacterium]|jgi:indolepyruvate ferredoxin oxidoreductase beta subunit|nr:indolepyruvate oxidoreductase subunit beta [Syntrophorhabdaceae bacterium]